jgi:chromosome segregation ATPase
MWDSLRAEINALKSKNKIAENDLAAKNLLVGTLTTDKSKLEKEKKERDETIAHSTKEITSLTQELKSKSKFEEDWKKEQKDHKATQKTLDDTKKEVTKLEAENKKMKGWEGKNKKLEEDLEAEKSKLEKANDKLAGFKELEEKAKKMDEYRQKAEYYKSSYQHLQKDSVSLVDFKNKLADCEQAKTSFQSQIQQLTTLKQTAENNLNIAQQNVAECNIEKERNRSITANCLKSGLDNIKNEVKELECGISFNCNEAEVTRLRTQIENLRPCHDATELQSLMARLDNYQRICRSIKNARNVLSQDYNRNEIDRLTSELAGLNPCSPAAKSEINSLKNLLSGYCEKYNSAYGNLELIKIITQPTNKRAEINRVKGEVHNYPYLVHEFEQLHKTLTYRCNIRQLSNCN